MHITINTGAILFDDYPERGVQNTLNYWFFPIIQAGGGTVPDHEDFRLTITLRDEFAVFEIYYNNELIATSYVVWEKNGSDMAWELISNAYGKHLEILRDRGNLDSFFMPDKPLSQTWTATLLGLSSWDDALLSQADWLARLVRGVGLAILDYSRLRQLVGDRADMSYSTSIPQVETIRNGEENISSVYFGSDLELSGGFLVSFNKGALCLIWPRCRMNEVKEMMRSKEIIITTCSHRPGESLEILFDDHSDKPYVLHMTNPSILTLLPAEPGGRPWTLSVWILDDGRPRKILDRMTYWRSRNAPSDLRPRSKQTDDG